MRGYSGIIGAGHDGTVRRAGRLYVVIMAMALAAIGLLHISQAADQQNPRRRQEMAGTSRELQRVQDAQDGAVLVVNLVPPPDQARATFEALSWESTAQVSAVPFDTAQVTSSISGPLIAEQLTLHLAIDHYGTTGYLSSAEGFAMDQDADTALNATLVFEPDVLPDLSAHLTVSYGRADANVNRFIGTQPLDPLAQITPHEDTFLPENDRYAISVALQYDLTDMITLSSSTTYDREDQAPGFQSPFPEGFTNGASVFQDITETVEVTYDNGKQWSWTLGSSYGYNDQDYALVEPAGRVTERLKTTITTSAVFAQIRYRPHARWTFTVGGRYQVETINETFGIADPAEPIEAADVSMFTPMAAATYNWTPHLSLTASARRGDYHSTDAFSEAVEAIRGESFVQGETADSWTYALHLRSLWLQGHLRLHTYMAYTVRDDRQEGDEALGPDLNDPTFAFVVQQNPGDTQHVGVELEAVDTPVPGVDLSGSLSYANPGGDPVVNAFLGEEVAGNDLQLASQWTATFGGTYRAPFGLVLSLNGSYGGDTFSLDTNTLGQQTDDSVVLHGRVGYEHKQWQLSFFGTNLSNIATIIPEFGDAGSPLPGQQFGVELWAQY